MAVRRPAVTVVIPVYNVEPYVAACLDSVLSQDFASFEVIAVDDGSTDRSAAIVQEYAARDRRIRLLSQEHGGQGRARNLAVADARGEFLIFVDSDDIVPPGSFAFLVSALRRSGSDFAVAGVRRIEGSRTFRPSWTAAVHEHDRTGVRIDDFPAALSDVVAHHRILSREFWTERVGEFPSGVYEDHVPMVAAYLRARRFDVLSRVTYEWRLREEGTSTGQQKHTIQNLLDRVAVKAEARELVRREASPGVQAAWVGRVLDIDLPPYIDHALRADDEYRGSLRDALSEYTAMGTMEALGYVRVQQKVRTHLAAHGLWDDVEVAQRFFRRHGSIPPTTIRDGGVGLVDELSGQLTTELPEHLLRLSASESRMQACAQRAEWLTPSRLRLTGWAVVRGVDLAPREPTLAIWLVAADGTRTDLPVEPVRLPEATRWVNWAHGSFDRAAFRTVIDADTLGGRGPWRLQVRVVVDGVVREGGLHHAVAGSSASRAAIGHVAASAGSAFVPRYDGEHGLTFSSRGARDRLRSLMRSDAAVAEVVAVEAHDEGLTLRTSKRGPREMVLTDGAIRVSGIRDGPEAMRFSTGDDGGQALPSGQWRVQSSEGRIGVATALAQTLPIETVTTTHRVRFAIDGAAGLRIELGPPLADDELGTRAQQLLRDAYASKIRMPEVGIMLVPRSEAVAGDGLMALDREARETGLRRWCAVPDLAAVVPDGAEPVIIGSRRWYAVLAQATVIASEVDLEWWYAKRPHQRLLRLFATGESEQVGRSAWWAAGLTPGQIADELARAATWDAIVVPDIAVADRYRGEFDYRGPVIAAGPQARRILGKVASEP